MFLSSNWKALLKDSKQPRCEKSAKRKRRKGEESRSSAGGGSVLPAGSDSKDAGLTAVMAIDCEMVGVGRGGKRSMLARCSIVNFRGQVLYDKYVKPMEAVTDYRTEVSGIRPSHLNSDAAITFAQCQKEVASLLERRVLVGHSISNDLKSLLLSHPKHLVRDTVSAQNARLRASLQTRPVRCCKPDPRITVHALGILQEALPISPSCFEKTCPRAPGRDYSNRGA